jgi:hypothetical protein
MVSAIRMPVLLIARAGRRRRGRDALASPRYVPAMNQEIQQQVEALAREFAARVTRLVAQAIADEVEGALARHVKPGRAPAEPRGVPARPERELGPRPLRAQGGPRRRAEAVERWVPDRRARRVPNFVAEATGLRTKKDIVERYGEHAIFGKGKPAPPALRAREGAE